MEVEVVLYVPFRAAGGGALAPLSQKVAGEEKK